ncbi:MAG: DMT family transporter [Sphaerochaeta sp.]|jgi:drug/metabolite transporter (DMT)-like permease|nr:DMT family transporter [Sphaerochaeta sp.]MCI2096937.1 DMT family transporter [Sphaerochaeta sp.]MCI2103953.1 DMT family transporter [Sphaerochaeta sp.]
MMGTVTYNLRKGTILILLTSLGFGLLNLFVRLAGPVPFLQKLFFRNIVALVFTTVLLLVKGKGPRYVGLQVRQHWGKLLLRASCGTVGMIGNFFAVDHLLLSDASMLNKMAPFFTVVFSALFLKEKVRGSQIICLVTAFLGSLLVVKPSFSNMLLVPGIVGFIGGMGAGAAYTVVRSLGKEGTDGNVIIWFFSLFTTLVTLPFLLFSYYPMHGREWFCLMMAGAFGCMGQFCVTAAYRYAPAREIGVYDYSQVLFSAILGVLVFGQVPDVLSLIGYVIIIGVGVVMFTMNRSQQPTQVQ